MSPNPADRALRLKYEPEYDLLSVWVGAPQVVDNIEVEPGVCVRVSRDAHTVVGLEVIEAAARFSKDAQTVQNPSFVQTLLKTYAARAFPSDDRVAVAR